MLAVQSSMHIEPFTITPPDGIGCSFGVVQGEGPPEWHSNDMEPAIEYAIREANAWIDA